MESILLVPLLFKVIWQLQLMIPTNQIYYIAHTAKNRNLKITKVLVSTVGCSGYIHVTPLLLCSNCILKYVKDIVADYNQLSCAISHIRCTK